jgi:cell division protein FtsI (penicillin-binding protein 3)
VDPVTRRYSKRDYVSIFVGFVPVHNPRLVILVMIDEPRGNTYGGVVAGPVFSEVGGWVLNYLQINPQLRMAKVFERPDWQSDGPDKGQPMKQERVTDIGDDIYLPDFRGKTMREVLIGGRALGLKVLPQGTGLAVKQSPRPGAPLKGITTLRVSFSPPT